MVKLCMTSIVFFIFARQRYGINPNGQNPCSGFCGISTWEEKAEQFLGFPKEFVYLQLIENNPKY